MVRGIRKTVLKGTGNVLMSTLLVSTAIAAGLAVTHREAIAQAQAQTSFSVPAGPLNRALTAFGRQARVQVTYLASVASAKTSPGFSGAATQEQALARILEGTGLRYSFPNATTVAISANVRVPQTSQPTAQRGLIRLTLKGREEPRLRAADPTPPGRWQLRPDCHCPFARHRNPLLWFPVSG